MKMVIIIYTIYNSYKNEFLLACTVINICHLSLIVKRLFNQ